MQSKQKSNQRGKRRKGRRKQLRGERKGKAQKTGKEGGEVYQRDSEVKLLFRKFIFELTRLERLGKVKSERDIDTNCNNSC